eukprot:12417932-Karenia_brevis.AAC.1
MPPPVAMRNSRGDLTCNPWEILACVVDAWSPIYHLFGNEPPPVFAQFMERYGDAVASSRHDFYIADPIGSDLWHAAQRRDHTWR